MASSKRKAQRQMAREQAKRDKRYSDKPEKKSSNEILGIKSIADYNKKSGIQNYTANLKVAWYFEKFYEKLILIVLCALGFWKIIGFF
jgi:hypothetical protein